MANDGSRHELVDTIGVDALRGFSDAPTERIEVERRRKPRESLDELRVLRSRGELALDLSETLGIGGEGVVRKATQVALARAVAVKKLRADRKSGDAEERLLVEAWIAGLLEHPNIVPIYDIQFDDDGDLIIIYKKIEGEPWSRAIADPVVARQLHDVADHLDFNLGVLSRVCDAVAYAHDRGIVHRDLKPANIMLGGYGEVYLTDWGIAGAIDDRYGTRIPLLSDDESIIGTPAYMAPEMLAPEDGEIGPRTDVYQLGAILYECLTGAPPHLRPDLEMTLAAISAGEAELDDSIPVCLRHIVGRAMAVKPEDRYASATDLKRAIEGFVRQRGALHVLERATRRLDRLRAALEGEAASELDRMELYRLLAECRFGFSEAAPEFPEQSNNGTRDAAMAMVDYELARDAPEAAQMLLAELEDPPADVSEKVEAALDAQRQKDERTRAYAEVGRRHDPNVGHATRKFFAVIMGVSVIFPPLSRLVAWYGFGSRLSPKWGVTSALISLAPLFLFAIVYRKRIRQSALTQAAATAVGIGIALSLVLSVTSVAHGWNPWIVREIYLFASAGITATFAFLQLPKLLPSAFMFLLCGILVSFDQHDIDYRDWLTVLANGTLIVNALWLWWPRPGRGTLQQTS